MASSPIAEVLELVRERLSALDIDADSYAEYVATVACDETVPAPDRRQQLIEMFAATLEDPDSIALSLSDVISEALRLFETLKPERQPEPTTAPSVDQVSSIDEASDRRPTPTANPAVRQLHRDDGAASLHVTGLDAATKRAILAQLALDGGGSEDESDGDGAGATRKGARGGRLRRKARDGVASGARTLDDALGEMSQLSKGHVGDTSDMGRRAKRGAMRTAEAAAAKGGAAAATAPPAGQRAVRVTDDPAMLLSGAHVGTVARLLGRVGPGGVADRHSIHQDRDADAADIIGQSGGAAGRESRVAVGARHPAGSLGKHSSGVKSAEGSVEGPIIERDIETHRRVPAAAAEPAHSGNSRLVVDYDPLAGPRPDNRGFARQLQREAADAMRTQHEADEVQRRQASEAARWVTFWTVTWGKQVMKNEADGGLVTARAGGAGVVERGRSAEHPSILSAATLSLTGPHERSQDKLNC